MTNHVNKTQLYKAVLHNLFSKPFLTI